MHEYTAWYVRPTYIVGSRFRNFFFILKINAFKILGCHWYQQQQADVEKDTRLACFFKNRGAYGVEDPKTLHWLSNNAMVMPFFAQSNIHSHSVLEQIWVKGSYLDQRLLQHESLYQIGLKSAKIEIHYIHRFFKIWFY